MKKVEDLLQQFLNRIGQSDGAPYVGLFRSWRGIVGDRIADHAEPVDVRGSALIVEADHPGWVQMVMFSREKILRELGRRYPELKITGMQIRVAGERAAGDRLVGDHLAANPGDAAESADIAGSAGTIPAGGREERAPSESDKEALTRVSDDELRQTLESLRKTLDNDG